MSSPPPGIAERRGPHRGAGSRSRDEGSSWRVVARRLTRDKSDTLLLLLSSLLVIAPHFEHLPLWTCGTVLLTLAWRAVITIRGTRMPPLWLLLPISIAAMAGVMYSYRTLLGKDPGVAMLALLLAFKLLEMHARRDLFVVVFLSFFLLLTNFFYSQSMLAALGMVVTLIVLLTAQLTFQYTGAVPPLMTRLKTAAKLFLMAAPLGLLLFVVFPRIQGPLWGLPGDAQSGRTGISDTMAPGSMANLARSDEVAFRVRFVDGVPPQDKLYWRGPVLSSYDGRTWTRVARRQSSVMRIAAALRGPAYPYELTMEPSNKRFLFTLEFSERNLQLDGQSASYTDELETYAMAPVTSRQRYQATAFLDYTVQPGLSDDDMRRWLQLPAGYNPRAREFGQVLASHGSPDAAIRAVLQLFRKEKFEYTLEPPLLGRDAVDEFLFNTRQGFCEHYASAFVFLMRSAGVPARVITGYQGGEFNPVDRYYTIRQSDAHAWAEVWLGRRGWVRVDPTAAVAPERVRQNLARTLPQPAPFGFEGLVALQNDKNSWLSQMRFSLSAMNNAWNQWVLDYNPDRQQNFLKELGSTFANWRTLAGLALIAALIGFARWRQQVRQTDPVEAAFSAFCAMLARRGLHKAPDDGPMKLAARVKGLNVPGEKKAAMTGFLDLYGALKYGVPQAEERTQSVKRLATLLKQSQ
ncbi:transglutaminaseTgpA domain-containing protein [Pseudoduganella sp. RAF19]|uniref:transglutaminase family protein n=3 Tax=unclassified Pseudoduganella TaxID=2637179 RepID=UPI003F99B210